MREIIPTVFCQNMRCFTKRFSKVSNISRFVQVDIADGKFVSTKSVDINSIPSFSRSKLILEAHLMVDHPEKYVDALRRKGFKKIIFHLETVANEDACLSLVDRITALGMVPVLAINPGTRMTKKVIDLMLLTNFVLIMGVNPGKEKQKLIRSVFPRIKKVKSLSKKMIVQVDGGVNIKNAKKLFLAGADILNSGSYISESKDPKKALKDLLV